MILHLLQILIRTTMTNKFRKLAFAAFLSVTALATTTMTSCKKDDTCAAGYEGSDCKTMISTKFIGAYDGSETCTIGSDSYTVTLTAMSSDNMKMTLTNLYNDNYTLTATITESNKFSISGTDKGVTFTGDGTLSGSVLTIKYTAANATLSNSCTFTGTKK